MLFKAILRDLEWKVFYVAQPWWLTFNISFAFIFKKKLYGPFLRMEFNYLKARATSSIGGSLLFTTKFPEIPGTHFIDLERMKVWVDLWATQWFWIRDPWIGNPAP